MVWKMKTCTCCKVSLPDNKFYKRTYKSGRVGLQPKCKTCDGKLRVKYYRKHDTIRRKLNISDEDYQKLMQSHDGTCDVCGRSITKVCIDHNHLTGKVRGLLCNNCNTALGLVGDNVSTLTKLIQYLEQ